MDAYNPNAAIRHPSRLSAKHQINTTSSGLLLYAAEKTNTIVGPQQADSKNFALYNGRHPISHLKSESMAVTAVINTPVSLNPATSLFLEQFASLHAIAGSTDEYLTSPLEKWHQQFLQDTRDAYWSSMAQAQVESSLSMSMGSTLELVSVQCASSVCEIQVASNSAQVSEKAASDWQSTLSKMASESWWQSYGFDSQNYAQSIASDGRAIFVSYFNRATGSTP
jgi:hypothetical protein